MFREITILRLYSSSFFNLPSYVIQQQVAVHIKLTQAQRILECSRPWYKILRLCFQGRTLPIVSVTTIASGILNETSILTVSFGENHHAALSVTQTLRLTSALLIRRSH